MLIWAIALKVRGIISTVNIVSGLPAGYQRAVQVGLFSALLTRPQACGRWFMANVLAGICVVRSLWRREAEMISLMLSEAQAPKVPA